jgi:putative membrane protein
MSPYLILFFKAMHVIFVITWFAALFYIVRLFIYQTEANEKEEPERTILVDQLKLMSKRLWLIIGWPSAILALIFGSGMLHTVLSQPWFHLKLGLVVLLYVYHHILHFRYKELQKGVYKYSSTQLRILNEVATLFLFAIVFLAIYKNLYNITYYTLGMVGLTILLYVGIVMYKRKRKA